MLHDLILREWNGMEWNEMQVDLVGGYYDAGDNVKFGFPMAFTTTMLSWSVIEFGGMMKGELQHAKDAIRWATDYLLKATAHPNTIYVQVSLFLCFSLFLVFFLCKCCESIELMRR